MNARHRNNRLLLLTLAALVLAMAPDVHACAVCFGDADSPMAKGVVWGVLVLAGITGFVLVGVAATGLVWLRRSRRLAELGGGEGFTPGAF